jgi:hypothetical protein
VAQPHDDHPAAQQAVDYHQTVALSHLRGLLSGAFPITNGAFFGVLPSAHFYFERIFTAHIPKKQIFPEQVIPDFALQKIQQR